MLMIFSRCSPVFGASTSPEFCPTFLGVSCSAFLVAVSAPVSFEEGVSLRFIRFGIAHDAIPVCCPFLVERTKFFSSGAHSGVIFISFLSCAVQRVAPDVSELEAE
jgi:hypothetical protein